MTAYTPTKILYAISSLANEGPTRVLLNVVRNLDRQQFMPSVVTLSPEKTDSLLAEFQALRVPVIQLSGASNSSPTSTLMRLNSLRRILAHGDYHIAHAHCPRSLFFLVATRSRRLKSIYTAHIYPDAQYKVIHGAIKGPFITAGVNLAMRIIDQPVACSDSVAAEYLEKRKYLLPAVNNGIEPLDLARFGGRQASLKSLGLDPARRYLLFVGRLSAEKRVVELVRTFMAASLSNIDLVVLGAGPEESAIREIANGHVHVAGFHKDIRPYLAACDCYISPSATEGLANTLLEAMSVGMPALLSDIPSHRFVLKKCSGFVGRLFDPLSTDSLLAGVEELFGHDMETLRADIQDNFKNLFHAQVMTAGYEIIYKEILK